MTQKLDQTHQNWCDSIHLNETTMQIVKDAAFSFQEKEEEKHFVQKDITFIITHSRICSHKTVDLQQDFCFF